MCNESSFKLYSAVKESDVKWLWYPYIPLGKITVLQGDPGDGKSTFILNLAACLTTPMLLNGENLKMGSGLYFRKVVRASQHRFMKSWDGKKVVNIGSVDNIRQMEMNKC